MKNILIFTCFFTLAGCHSAINEKTEQLDSTLSALQYWNSSEPIKEMKVIFSGDNGKYSIERNRVFSELSDLFNNNLQSSEKCFELAERSVNFAKVAESYSEVSDCAKSFFANKNYLDGIKLLSYLSENKHLLRQNEIEKLNLLLGIFERISINMMYTNSVGSLAAAEKAVITVRTILASYEKKIDKTEKLKKSLISAQQSVEKAKNRVLKVKEMKEKELLNL